MLSVTFQFKNASSLSINFTVFASSFLWEKQGEAESSQGVQREDEGQLSLRTAALSDHGFRTDVATSVRQR